MSAPRFPRDADAEWPSRSRRYWQIRLQDVDFSPSAPAPSPSSFFAIQGGGDSTDRAFAVARAPDGSVFVCGQLTTPATFGSISLEAIEENAESFVARVSASGEWMWVRPLFSDTYLSVNGIAALPDGSAVVCGAFANSVTLGSIVLDPGGSDTGLVARIDADGAWLWATQLAIAEGTVIVDDIASTSDSRLLVVGHFAGGTLQLGEDSLTHSAESHTLFVARLVNDGVVWQWAAASTADSSGIYPTSISVSSDGSALVGGYFYGEHTIGETTLETFDGDNETAFIARVDASGQWMWAVRVGAEDSSCVASSVSAAADGAGLVGMSVSGEAVLAGDIEIPSSAGGVPFAVVARISAAGVFEWATKASNVGEDSSVFAHTIALRPDGSALLTGRFDGLIAFGETEVNAPADSKLFVVRITASGQWDWVRTAGAGAQGNDIAVFPDNSAVVVGSFLGSITIGTVEMEAPQGDQEDSQWDALVFKIGADGSLP